MDLLLEGLVEEPLEGLLLGKLLGLLDGSVDSWMAVMVNSLGLLDGFVDGFFDEALLGAGVGEWHDAKHESRKSCSSYNGTPIDVSFFSQHSDFVTHKVSQGFASPPHDPPISTSQLMTQTPSQLMYHSGVQTIALRTLLLSPQSASARLSAFTMASSLISGSYTSVNSTAVAALLDDLSSTRSDPET